MKVCIDAHMAGERETGNETYIVNLIAALLEQPGPERYVVCVTHPEALLARVRSTERLHLVPVSPSPWRRLFVDIPRLVRRERVAVLHMTYAAPPFPGCPVVTTIHDVAYRVQPAWFSTRDYWVLKGGIELTGRHAERIVTVSEHARSEICARLRVPRERVAVTYEAADPAFTRLPPEGVPPGLPARYGLRAPYLMALGNLQPRKNLARLVEAFARVKRHGLPHQLALVGKAQWRESEIFGAVRRHGLESEVVATGYVPTGDLVPLLNGCACFAYPSLYEGFGLPILEAMACGAPVLTSRAASMPEVAGEAALLVDPESVDEMARGLRSLLSDEALRGRLRAAGLRQAARFSWDRTAAETLAVYRQAAGA